MNNLTEDENNELNQLCEIWNNLYGNADVDLTNDFPLKRIAELNRKGNSMTLLKVRGCMEIIGSFTNYFEYFGSISLYEW